MHRATRLEYLLVRWVDSSPRNHQNLYICTSLQMYLRRSCVERIHAHMHARFNQDYMKFSFLYLWVNNEWLTGLFTSWKSAYTADWEIFAVKNYSAAKIKHANISYVKKKLRENFPIYGICSVHSWLSSYVYGTFIHQHMQKNYTCIYLDIFSKSQFDVTLTPATKEYT